VQINLQLEGNRDNKCAKTPIELLARVKVAAHNEKVSDIDARAHDQHFEQQQQL
jgi:hypothetical protein